MLPDAFERVRRDRRTRPAIFSLSEQRTMTIGDLADESEAVASAFARARVPPARPLVTLIGNRAAFVSTFLACARHGSVMVPLDGDNTMAEALAFVDRFDACGLVVRRDLTIDRAHTRIDLPNGLALLARPRGDGPEYANALLFKLTSGSTGIPRAVVASAGNLVNDGLHIVEAMGIGADAVNLAAIPLSHSYGLGNVIMPLVLQGSPMVLRDAFAPPRLFDDIRDCGATVLPGVPFMFDYIRRHLASARFPPSMRTLITAGARISAETLADFKRTFGLKIHSFYGTSETGGIAYDPSDAVSDPVTMGPPMPGVSLTFRDSPGAAGGERRLHVRGEAVASGYALDAESTRDAFVDGGYLTGDLGYADEEGRVFLTGRVSRFINVAGRKVHPDEVARVLVAYPGVADAEVFGVADPARGQALVACLVADPDRVDVVAVRRHCAQHLSAYKIPRQLILLRALPVDARGKTDHRALEALVAGACDGARFE